MSDNELINYIKKVETNFENHIENGSIEMSLEYYNLCEELMARGINAIQENQQIKGSLQTHEILLKANVEENQKLKEQLQQKEDTINKAKEELYIWGEALFPEFQKKMLQILDNKGDEK